VKLCSYAQLLTEKLSMHSEMTDNEFQRGSCFELNVNKLQGK